MPEADNSRPQRIALLGVPIEIGASQAGPLMGPDALRPAGIARLLEQLDFHVDDHGNLAIPAGLAHRPVPAPPQVSPPGSTGRSSIPETVVKTEKPRRTGSPGQVGGRH